MEFIFNLWMGVTAKDGVFVGFGKSGGYCAQSTACCYNAATHSDDRREVTFEFNICHDTKITKMIVVEVTSNWLKGRLWQKISIGPIDHLNVWEK